MVFSQARTGLYVQDYLDMARLTLANLQPVVGGGLYSRLQGVPLQVYSLPCTGGCELRLAHAAHVEVNKQKPFHLE